MRLSKLCILCTSLITFLPWGGVAFAQRGAGGPMAPQQLTRFQLATLPEVQSELALDESLKKSASEMSDKMREEQRSLMQDGGGNRQGAMAKVNELRRELDKEFVAKLDEKQRSRLTGIMVQVVGAGALMDSEVQSILGMTDDQKKSLTEAQAKNREASREAMQGQRDRSQEERAEQMAKLRAEADKALLSVLTDEQKTKLTEIKGTELRVDLAPLRGRGGPGGRQRRDN